MTLIEANTRIFGINGTETDIQTFENLQETNKQFRLRFPGFIKTRVNRNLSNMLIQNILITDQQLFDIVSQTAPSKKFEAEYLAQIDKLQSLKKKAEKIMYAISGIEIETELNKVIRETK